MRSALAATCLVIGLVLLPSRDVLAQSSKEDQREIEAIVETFRKAIIDKDVDSFMPLFLHEDITWTGTTSRASLAAGKERGLSGPPTKSFNSKPRSFIEGIAKAREPREETFENVRIDSDGEVAQVWFDYTFLANGRRQNWGKESWQMMRTDDGWKIAAVVWSMTFNLAPPDAKKKD